jgi:hypothetical protein
VELGERASQVGQVVQHRVPEQEVEALVGERQRLRVGAGGLDVEPESLGVGAQRRDHPRRDVGAGDL